MNACLLDVVQTGVEVDELLVHLIEVLAEIVGEVLEQLLDEDGGGSHGSSGLQIPGVRVLLGRGPLVWWRLGFGGLEAAVLGRGREGVGARRGREGREG